MSPTSPTFKVQTKAGTVTGRRVYEPKRWPPRTHNYVIVGSSPFGEWRAILRELVPQYRYRYPDGSTPANNAAIRRVVAKICKWEDENPRKATP